jgi:predicted cobalt transporter CbtA
MLRGFDPARLRSALAVAVIVGVLAGLTSAVVQTVIGEPLIRDAIAIEEAHEAATGAGAGHAAEPELVSRETQSGVGLFAGLGLAGGAFGVLFALAFWGLRAGRPDPFRRALVAGAMLFGSLTLAPWLKYPPNPPAVGNPDTIDKRQALYVSLIALTLALCLVGAALATRLRREGWPEHRRLATVTLALAVPFAIALAVLPPAPDAVEAPATLIWRFRLASLGGNLLLWSVLTVAFGVLAAEAVRRRERSAAPPDPIPEPAARR